MLIYIIIIDWAIIRFVLEANSLGRLQLELEYRMFPAPALALVPHVLLSAPYRT